jgi:hypothetical protein
MRPVHRHRLDAGGAKLNAKGGGFEFCCSHGAILLWRSADLLRRILYIVSAFRGFDKMLSGFDWMGKKAGKRWMRFPVGASSLEIGICTGG